LSFFNSAEERLLSEIIQMDDVPLERHTIERGRRASYADKNTLSGRSSKDRSINRIYILSNLMSRFRCTDEASLDHHTYMLEQQRYKKNLLLLIDGYAFVIKMV